MSETNPVATSPTFVTTLKGYLAAVYHFAADLFAKAEEAKADIDSFNIAHPDVLAGVTTLENMAPANVREGINTAEQVVRALGNISGHAETVVKAVVPLLLFCLLSVAGCSQLGLVSPTSAAAVTTDLTAAKADLQTVVTMYQINKGLANVALPALPLSVASMVVSAEAAGDKLLATAQTTLDGAGVTVSAVEALVAQLQATANTLAVQSAGVIKVVPNTP